MTALNARKVVYYVEYEKPRVTYSKNKLNHNQRMLLAKSISSFENSCGAFLFPPDKKSKTTGTLCIRPSLQCAMQIEVPYYGSNVGKADKCSHPGGNNTVVSQKPKRRFKTSYQCASRVLTTERSLLHRDRVERKKSDFLFVNTIL